MDLRQLEYFVAVAEEGTFTRAAARVHVVQSAVSAAIKTLERELGATLLDRNSKRVLLTDAGEALLPKAQAVLDAATEARDAVAQVEGGLKGTVRLGTLTAMTLIDLPALLGEFHRRHPGVLVRTSAATSGSQGLVEQLLDRRLDLAFVSLPGEVPAGIVLDELAHSTMDLVVPEGHPLAANEEVPIGALAGMDFIDSPVGYGNRAVADRAFAQAAVPRRVTLEMADIVTGVDFVRHGLGVALLPHYILGTATGVTTLKVTGADLRWPLGLARPADRTPTAAARALIAVVHEIVRRDRRRTPA
ncbi:LysR family transcriptional regulator [Lentzea flava]|uniref:LysR family transcriptional regulator n=1 Tax=Lentzea flava TaxID=103732 RepID=A0ABQ2UKH0_9PSEU|nr:LysR family transcriptional regulator [Lentzea flava]MCP2199664.1 DNA-binding transcriptional regulator, LysR family [Lentzea flava]GGU39170.1 LysR family transcriptional regulator [Lentzea flava]